MKGYCLFQTGLASARNCSSGTHTHRTHKHTTHTHTHSRTLTNTHRPEVYGYAVLVCAGLFLLLLRETQDPVLFCASDNKRLELEHKPSSLWMSSRPDSPMGTGLRTNWVSHLWWHFEHLLQTKWSVAGVCSSLCASSYTQVQIILENTLPPWKGKRPSRKIS